MSATAVPRHLALSLLLIRASVVLMLAPWIVDKFRNFLLREHDTLLTVGRPSH